MLTVLERRKAQSRFTSALMLMGTADVYWDDTLRRPLSRQIDGLRKKRKPNVLPPGVIFVGRYSYGASSRDFLDDLAIVLADLEKSPAPAGTGNAPMQAAA